MSARAPGLGIGEVTKLFGLTPRSVRYYEARGLLTSTRDRQNCRRFDYQARSTLELIAQLRRAGLSIPDIQSLLVAREAGGDLKTCAQQLVSARRQALELQLAELDAVETWLAQAVAGPVKSRRLFARAA